MEEILIQAIRSGKVSEVNDIIRSNHPIKWSVIVKKTGWDALHLACLGGHDAIVVLLLALPGIDVNVKMKTGWTSFSLSVQGKDLLCSCPSQGFQSECERAHRFRVHATLVGHFPGTH